MAYIVSVGIANAAVRDANSVSRNTVTNNTAVVSRAQTTPRTKTKSTVSRATTARAASTVAKRTTPPRATSASVRTSTPARTTQSATMSRTATISRATNSPARTTTANVARTATNKSRPARAATTSNTFGTEYNACRDAYFTCMDQFCATQNDTYRRCVCSSRLSQIKSRENLLSDTATQLQDFKDFNIGVIDKSAAEVNAMVNATTGESIASSTQDTSASAQQLTNIGNILAKAKSQSLSTAGTLDIGGNIKQIWQTTDLADGANIANLTGESLYNAVHAQCSQMVANTCESKSTLNMVVSAYGMYIENDCTALSNNLDTKTNAAKGSVRETEHEMHNARLENYNAHNSTSIHDCIANVRKDLTSENACGTDYVHCLDVTGRYLNRETGEPIYTSEFYQLNGQISLSGNVLTNQTNRMIVAELNRMRSFAEPSLDTCRDIADAVWDEFVRQAIAEIYQGQQSRIRDVKNECLDVVNACYDEQSQSLKDFSNVKEQLLLGQRLELSEELCREKLEACSNLYGGGPDGFNELLNTMHDLTDSKIAKECRITLQDFARDICAVPSSDTLHGYPYACRVYAPGEQKYAQINTCNQQLWNKQTSIDDETYVPPVDDNDQDSDTPSTPTVTVTTGYTCPSIRMYTSCNKGYYMTTTNENDEIEFDPEPKLNNNCTPCPKGYECDGHITNENGEIENLGPKAIGSDDDDNNKEEDDTAISDQDKYGHNCGDYPGSLYQRLVRYAIQACVRPSNANSSDYSVSTDVLADVNAVMDSIRVDMGVALAKECERLGGTWVDTMWVDETYDCNCPESTYCPSDRNIADGCHDITGDTLYKTFYDETGANTNWGYCKPTTATQQTIYVGSTEADKDAPATE